MSQQAITWMTKFNKYEIARKKMSEYYFEIYGTRWTKLLEAMEKPITKVGRLNRHAEWSLSEITDTPFFHPTLPGCLEDLKNLKLRSPFIGRGSRLKPYYTMNTASVRAALELGVEPDDKVLDCCAAPGGKTLIFDHIVSDGKGEIVANDIKALRRKRLQSVFDEYLPKERKDKIKIKGLDATKWGQLEKERYDKIMLDVPCGAERIFLRANRKTKAKDIEWIWSEKTSRQTQQTQYMLLVSALETLKIGGTILYVTCSISPFENDGIIGKCLKKKKDRVQIKKMTLPVGERTKFGWMILPDVCDGEGPMYLCKLIKVY